MLGSGAEVQAMETWLNQNDITTYVPEKVTAESHRTWWGIETSEEDRRAHHLDEPVYRLMVDKKDLEQAMALADTYQPTLVPLEEVEHLLPTDSPTFEHVCPHCGGKTFMKRKVMPQYAMAGSSALVWVVGMVLSMSWPIWAALGLLALAIVTHVFYRAHHRCTQCHTAVELSAILVDAASQDKPSATEPQDAQVASTAHVAAVQQK